MCLIKTHRFPKLSSKPIKVWKVVDTYCSSYYHAPYTRVAYMSNIIKCSAKCAIIKGIFKNVIHGEGVHAYRSRIDALRSDYYIHATPRKIIEAEIPPFTPYWLGKECDIAATKMILKTDIK